MALNFLLKRSGTASKRPDAVSMDLGEIDLNYNSDTGGVYYKDSAGNVVKVGPCQVSVSEPNSTPAGSAGNSVGEFWYDIANQSLQVWNGSAWVDATSTASLLPLSGGTMSGDIVFAGTQSIPVSSIESASTSQPGVVQLNDTTSSTSTTEALTANQGKELQTQINALSVASNILLAGTLDATTGNLVTVTSEGTAAGFTAGSPLPSPVAGNDNYFVIITVPGTMTPPGGSAQECHQGDWWLSDGTAWVFLDVGFNATAATTSTPGVVQLATDAEVQAGLNTDHAVTSNGLQSKVSDSTSTTSSTALASSTAVKSAYDAGIQGQTDAAAALAAANTAGTDVGTLASLTTTDKTSAVAAINEVNAAASAAQGDATQALSDASAAQATADQAVLDAAAAQTDATQALSDASAAQATADAAVPDASYTALGDILSGTGAGTYAALTLGTNTNVLTVDSTCPGGVKWAAGTPAATPTTLGTLFGRNTGNNISLGYGSLENLTTGASNTAVGSNAAVTLTTGRCNTAVGDSALGATPSGRRNSAFGWLALGGLSDASCGNTAIGSCALLGTYSGSYNTAIGFGSGDCLGTGSFNVFIGCCVQVADWNGSCQLAIGFSPTDNWLTGTSTKAIKPGAGIIDCAASTGTAGQVLMSNGSNAICWGAAGGGGGSPATPTVAGIVLGCTTASVSAIGCNALLNNTTGVNNVAFGCGTLTTSTTGNRNTAIGDGALAANTTGENNTAVGCGALSASTTARQNTGVGCGALRDNTTGSCNTAVGQGALALNTTGFNNAGAGVSALVSNTTGDNNTAAGRGSLLANTTGIGNTSVGSFALSFNTTGDRNTAVGRNALLRSETGCSNVAVGACSGCSYTTESGNVILGNYIGGAGDTNTITLADGLGVIKTKFDSLGALSFDGTSFGTAGEVLQSNGPGAKPTWGTAAGGSGTVTSITAGAGLTGGTITTTGTIDLDTACVIQPTVITAKGGLITGTAASTPTALGVGTDGQVLTADSACTSGLKWAAGGGGGGSFATPIACGVVYGCSNGSDNVSLGFGAIRNMCGTSIRNVALGNNAMVCLTTNHCCNVAIGTNAMFGSFASTNFRCNVAIGNASMANVTGTNIGNNVYVGADTAAFGTGSNNVALGFCSQRSNCGSGNTSVGSASLAINTGNNNVAVGLNAGCTLGSTAACNILIGPGAGGGGSVGSITGSANIIIGIDKAPPVPAGSTQLVLGGWLTGCSTLAIKPAAGVMDCVNSTGTAGQVLMSNGANAVCWGTAGGGSAATPTVAGTLPGCSTATVASVGCNAMRSLTTGLCSTSTGVNALCSMTSGCYNTAIGYNASAALTSAISNTSVGFGAGSNTTTGNNNTAIGVNAMFGIATTVTGQHNLALGTSAMFGVTTGSGNIALGGAGSSGSYAPVFGFTTECNRVAIGSTNVTNAYVKVAWTVTSDARDKTNITALPVGLEFVNKLNPVSFQFRENRESDIACGPLHYGFLAQEVLAAEGENPVIIDTEKEESLKMVNDHLNAVFVKAIQELSAKNDALEARIALLENA